MKTFSPEEFVTALRSPASLQLPVPALKITGMVQPLPPDIPDAFSFSPGTSCTLWVTIPTKIVEKIDYLGKSHCQNDEHDKVRLHFKTVTDPEALPFAQLLHAHAQQRAPFTDPSTENVGLGLDGNRIADTNSSLAAFGWHPPHIPSPHWPPIHLPDPREALHKQAEHLALATAVKVDHDKGNSTYCPREEIRAAILAVGMTLYLTPDPSGGSKYMAGVMGAIAVTLPDEYCRQSGR